MDEEEARWFFMYNPKGMTKKSRLAIGSCLLTPACPIIAFVVSDSTIAPT